MSQAFQPSSALVSREAPGDPEHVIRTVVSAAEGVGGGVRVVAMDVNSYARVERQLAEEAARLGYVWLHPEERDSIADRSVLAHRHLILVCVTPSDCAKAVPWVRRLAQTSPRRHLVLWPDRGSASLQTQAGIAEAEPNWRAPACRVFLHRAERWLRRGRPRAAERWLAAAAATARRHGATEDADAMELDLCRLLIETGRFQEAARRVRPLLQSGDLRWRAYADAGALWADVTLSTGRIQEANAWLHGLAAEALMRAEPLPIAVREIRARSDFWSGTAPPAPSATNPSASTSSEELGWIALALWRDEQHTSLEDLVSRLDARAQAGDARARFWLDFLRVLSPGPPAAAATVLRRTALFPRLHLLARAAVARAWLLSDQRGRALKLLGTVSGNEPERQLVRLLSQRAQSAVDSRAMRRSEVAGLPGLECFLTERTTMVSVDGLGRLIKVMEDASDEFGAVTAGCAWVRRPAPEVNVGVVSADRLRLVAGCGWKPADVAGAMAAIPGEEDDEAAPTEGFLVPVRYGGAVIGHVAVGPGQKAPLLSQSAQALAMLAGPAVRACIDALDVRGQEREGLQEILGRSPSIVDVRTAIARAAATPFPVLVEGESGTGKELVARAIHRLSARRDRRFLAVNCAALTDELVEAELFGHARGAFTGAVGPRAGLFEEAHGGTLFLDEVAELSPRAQAKLLRVLQEREIRRVGENATRVVDVRVVAATNTPLADAVSRGRFRDDLRFRLAVVAIRLPTLQERLEDLPLLTHVFWRRALAETGKRAFLGPDALAQLARHSWPGNVRELQNVIAGLAVAAPTCGRVTARHVSQVVAQVSGSARECLAEGQPLEVARKVFERRHVAQTLARHAGRRTPAARDLGLTRQGLAKTLRRLGLADEGAAAGVA